MKSFISLTNSPNQAYTVTIPGDSRNITFIITQSFNAQAGYWTLGIHDNANVPIVLGVPLLCGYNLLEQYGYLDIGELYVVNVSDQTIEAPDDNNIAENFQLEWVLN